MPGKRGAAESSKKAAGQARKADAANAKTEAKQREVDARESAKWEQGTKDGSKKEAAAEKAAELARKKAERAALEAEEMASLKSAKTGNAKNAPKKVSKGLSLDQLEATSTSKAPALNATGIENAIDALSLTQSSKDSLDRHPERRYPAAYAAFETRRLEELKEDKSLRRQQKTQLIRKEFEKHPDNPFNQVNVMYNASKNEIAKVREQEKSKAESRLTTAS